MNNNYQLRVFSGRANVPLADKIAQCLGDSLGKITLQNFPDGEFLARIDEDVRGRDVFVVQPTCPPVNENIMELLIILDSLKRAIAIVDKRRSSATETKQVNLIGSTLQNKVAVIFDDMISTAGSVVGAINVAKRNGAREIYACATHGVLCGEAISRLRDAPIKQIVITDTIPLTPDKQLPTIKVLSVAPILADAIKRI